MRRVPTIFLLIAASHCAKAKFVSTKPSEARAVPKDKSEICVEDYQAARIAFVVDVSFSNRETDPQVQDQGGGAFGSKTNRQEALFTVAKHLISLDNSIRKNAPEFVGTEMGFAIFPKKIKDFKGTPHASKDYEILSGAGPFPSPMTNTSDIKSTDKILWDFFDVGEKRLGAGTPYSAAFTAAYKLLKDTRQEGDVRTDILFFLTDGMPTEPTARVLEARKNLKDTTVVSMVYGTNVTIEELAGAPKSSKSAPTNDSKYEFLKGISDHFITIENSKELSHELKKIFEVVRSCKK